MMFSKPFADRVAKLRVPFGFVMVAAFLWFSRPSWQSFAIGLPVAFAGLALRAWAAGHLQKDRDLTESGPYAHLRNPLYVGTLTAAAGFAIASARWELGLLFAVVFLLIYLPVVDLEEQHLRDLFPDFESFAQRVPRLLPRVTPAAGRQKAFSLPLYLKNREYQAGIGFALAAAAVVVKMLI